MMTGQMQRTQLLRVKALCYSDWDRCTSRSYQDGKIMSLRKGGGFRRGQALRQALGVHCSASRQRSQPEGAWRHPHLRGLGQSKGGRWRLMGSGEGQQVRETVANSEKWKSFPKTQGVETRWSLRGEEAGWAYMVK